MPQTRRADKNMAARMRAQIDAAISNGEQVQPFSSTQGSFLKVGNRKVKLQNKDGSLTTAGQHYWERVDETPPLMYSYDQPIINNSVMGFNGKRVIVRKRVNGQWQITKKGEDYYRYNRNEYVVHVPVRRVVYMKDNVYVWANGSGSGDTFPVAEMQYIGTNHHGYPVPAFEDMLVLPKITVQVRLAEEHERQAYMKEGVLAKIQENTTIDIHEVGPRHVVGFESSCIWVYDPTQEWTISIQHANFFEQETPTIETILQRPLHGASAVPIGMIYPWGLDERCQEDTGTCVVDMIYECALMRSNHKYKHCFSGWDACKEACEKARKAVYPDASQYPYGGEHDNDYGNGYTAEVVIHLAKQEKYIIYILHQGSKIYQWRPRDDGLQEKSHLPVICFTIHDDHAFYYKRNNERGEAIESISKMALRTSLQSFPVRKIDICGEEEREKVPTFENWKN